MKTLLFQTRTHTHTRANIPSLPPPFAITTCLAKEWLTIRLFPLWFCLNINGGNFYVCWVPESVCLSNCLSVLEIQEEQKIFIEALPPPAAADSQVIALFYQKKKAKEKKTNVK